MIWIGSIAKILHKKKTFSLQMSLSGTLFDNAAFNASAVRKQINRDVGLVRLFCFIQAFFRAKFVREGIDSYVRGMVSAKCQNTDRLYVTALTKNMFTTSPPDGLGTDVVSLNIQRGRDHGMPSECLTPPALSPAPVLHARNVLHRR